MGCFGSKATVTKNTGSSISTDDTKQSKLNNESTTHVSQEHDRQQKVEGNISDNSRVLNGQSQQQAQVHPQQDRQEIRVSNNQQARSGIQILSTDNTEQKYYVIGEAEELNNDAIILKIRLGKTGVLKVKVQEEDTLDQVKYKISDLNAEFQPSQIQLSFLGSQDTISGGNKTVQELGLHLKRELVLQQAKEKDQQVVGKGDFKILLQNLSGRSQEVMAKMKSQVQDIKNEIAQKENRNSSKITFVYNREELEDGKYLQDYGVKYGHIIMMFYNK